MMVNRAHSLLRFGQIVTERYVSTSPIVSISMPAMFRPKRDVLPSTEHPELSELRLARDDVKSSPLLGSYEKAALQKIIDKGLGKVTRPYNPPTDLMERIRGIFEETFKDVKVDQPLQLQFPNRASKFHFLTSCERVFSYSVPNSLLYEMRTVEDVVRFYETPVSGANGLAQFQQEPDLPQNLHIRYDYYDEDTDPIYGGVTANPHRDRIPRSLKGKKLYKPIRAERDWPKSMDVHKLNRGHFPNPALDQHYPD